MKEIKRDIYLEKLISRRENGLIKVVTGIRRKTGISFGKIYNELISLCKAQF